MINIEEDCDTMTLSVLLEGVTVQKMFQTLYGRMVVTHDVEIRSIQYDSRKVNRDDLFVAIRGTSSDGHLFIGQAISNGAKVVVVDNDAAMPDSYFMHTGVVKVVVHDTRIALAKIAARYYHIPSNALTMVGVTGTNGKTTTTHLIASILKSNHQKAGLIGTIEYNTGDGVVPATHTTPESLELNQMLSRMVSNNCSAAVLEVSSHALHQHRVEGMNFAAAVFTNLTQDHLDYHGTMDEYFNAKNILFKGLSESSWAIINLDDSWGERMMNATGGRILSYGINPAADISAIDISLTMSGMTFTIMHQGESTRIQTPLAGRFNVSNILAAFGAGIALGIPKSTIAKGIRTTDVVRGRFEQIVSQQGWTAVIDYAHTPDALQKALTAIHYIFDASKRGRIITVFGCGGNRDRTKRPQMAGIASELSDVVIVTSDNPRHEDPNAIIDEVMSGVKPGRDVRRESDRATAIALGLSLARSGDVVLVAGKGHEDYQVIGETKIHFSDREVIENYLRAHA